jgi:3-hydroxybutyryl-CoA dehydrogenase
MKLAFLANAGLRTEIQTKKMAGDVELIWANSLRDLIGMPSMDGYFDLDFAAEPARIAALAKLLPKPVIINAVTPTLEHIGEPFIRINGWPTFLARPICELAVKTNGDRQHVASVFDQLGWTYQLVPDTAGMVSARIVAMVINEAYFAFQDGVSSKADIDAAMKLGTNYPFGPFEWAQRIGLKHIYQLLQTLQLGDDRRYSISRALSAELSTSE